MAYEGWLRFGGNEVVNNERARGIASTAECPMFWLKGPRCSTLRDALGDSPYTADNLPDAPWYDLSMPDVSGRFYGVFGLSVSGLNDSTRSASVTESIDDGGVVGRTRKGSRQVRVRATLLARGRDALDYGVAWLNASLDPDACGQHGAGCGSTDLEYLTDCPPARGEVDDFTPWSPPVTNLFTNPNFAAGSGAVTIYENLFTNPEFAAGSGTVEVRRNLWTDPAQASVSVPGGGIARWIQSGGTNPPAMLEAGGWARFTADSGTASADKTITRGMNWGSGGLPVAPNATYTLSFESERKAGLPDFQVTRWEYDATGTQVVNLNTTPAQDPASGRWYTTFTTGASSRYLAVVLVRASGSWAAGDWYRFRRTLLEASAVLSPYFDGGFQQSPDPDLASAWTSAANASPSVLNGVPVAGMRQQDVLAIRSSKFGGSMRLIPTSATNNNSYAEANPYPGFLGIQTVMGTVHLEAPLTGSLYAHGLSVKSATPLAGSASAPNAAGSYPLRAEVNATSQGRIIFYHGGLLGSGDVYWTKGALVPGSYSGPAFSGAAPHPDPDFTTAWVGTPNASVTRVTGVPVAGLVAENCVAIRSSKTDRGVAYPLRLIPTSASNVTFVRISVPAPARSGGTVIATRYQDAPLTGSLHGANYSVRVDAPPHTAARVNVAGATDIRLPFGPLTGTYEAYLSHGGARGSGDVWYRAVGIFAGSYTGPWFSGDSLGDSLNRYAWLGAPNASASTHEVRQAFTRPRTDEEYEVLVEPYRRFLHGVTVTSGPYERELMNKGEFWGQTFEWTFTAGRPWVYSATRAVDLPVTPTVVIQDTPYNLAPYPSAELAGANVDAAVNYSTNPSVETNATGWSFGADGSAITTAMLAAGRVTGELAAVGMSAYRVVFTASGAGAGGRFWADQEVSLVGRPAGSRVSVNFWAAELLMAGTPVRPDIEIVAYWRSGSGGSVLRTDSLGTVPLNGGALSARGLLPPAGATHVLVRAIANLTSWPAGTVLRLYADALAVTVP